MKLVPDCSYIHHMRNRFLLTGQLRTMIVFTNGSVKATFQSTNKAFDLQDPGNSGRTAAPTPPLSRQTRGRGYSLASCQVHSQSSAADQNAAAAACVTNDPGKSMSRYLSAPVTEYDRRRCNWATCCPPTHGNSAATCYRISDIPCSNYTCTTCGLCVHTLTSSG